MDKRPLGKTRLLVSSLSLGTMTFGAQADEAASRSMVDLCLERGINFIDTANAYNAGTTEEILGRVLAGRRDKIVLASKGFVETALAQLHGGKKVVKAGGLVTSSPEQFHAPIQRFFRFEFSRPRH